MICGKLKEKDFWHGKAPFLEELAELTEVVKQAAAKMGQVCLSIA